MGGGDDEDVGVGAVGLGDAAFGGEFGIGLDGEVPEVPDLGLVIGMKGVEPVGGDGGSGVDACELGPAC